MGSEAFQSAQQTVTEPLRTVGTATLAELCHALGTNRCAAQAFPETLDRRGVTRREGGARFPTQGGG